MKRITVEEWRNLDPWEMCGQDKHCTKGCHDIDGCASGCIVPKLYIELAKREDKEESDSKEIYNKAIDDFLNQARLVKYHSNITYENAVALCELDWIAERLKKGGEE